MRDEITKEEITKITNNIADTILILINFFVYKKKIIFGNY